jgi:hypothetical protein
MSALGPVRLTLDDDLRTAEVFRHAFETPAAPRRIFEDLTILEIKYPRARPALFNELIDVFQLVPQRASKYRVAGAALGFGGFNPNVVPGSRIEASL